MRDPGNVLARCSFRPSAGAERRGGQVPGAAAEMVWAGSRSTRLCLSP